MENNTERTQGGKMSVQGLFPAKGYKHSYFGCCKQEWHNVQQMKENMEISALQILMSTT